MTIVAVWMAGMAACLAAWLVLRGVQQGLDRYRQAFHDQAAAHLDEAFLFIDPRQLWGAATVSAFGVAALLFALTTSLPLAVLLSAPLPILPFLASRQLRRRRMAQFERQLPGFLLSLAGALRAGTSLQGALQSLVPRAAMPLGQEFSMLLREQRMGLTLDEALAHLQRRMPVEGVLLLVALMRVATASGGNLAETLEGMSQMLRERLHLQGRIQALTAQGRMQARIMACLPVLLGGALIVLTPAAMAPLWQTPQGWAVLALMLFLEGLGIVLVRRIVAIPV